MATNADRRNKKTKEWLTTLRLGFSPLYKVPILSLTSSLPRLSLLACSTSKNKKGHAFRTPTTVKEVINCAFETSWVSSSVASF